MLKNKKGFTLVELLLVIVLIAIVAMITLPNVFNMLSSSKNKKYEEYEKLIIENLKLYNIDYKEELWDDEKENEIKSLLFDDLLVVNSDINIGKCETSNLLITKNNKKYNYYVCMSCIDDDGKVIQYGSGCDVEINYDGPTCTFGSPSTTEIEVGEEAIYTLTCTDNSIISTTEEEVMSGLKKTQGLNITNVVKQEGGPTVKYEIVVVGTSSGNKKVSLVDGIVKDSEGNGNISVQSSTIKIADSNIPECYFAGPSLESILLDETATYTLTCTDNIGIVTTTNEIKNSLTKTSGLVINSINRTGSKTNYTYDIEVKGITTGDKIITLPSDIIKDSEGNGNIEVISDPLKVIGDIVPPVIAKNGNASASYAKSSTTITIPIKITETDSGITTSNFAASDITVKVGSTTITPTNKTLTYNSVSNGVYSYTLTLKGLTGNGSLTLSTGANAIADGAGNKSIATNITTGVTVDNTAPVCTFAGPYTTSTGTTAQTYTKSGANVYYKVTCTDSVGITQGNITNTNFNTAITKSIGTGSVSTSTTRSGSATSYVYTITTTTADKSYGSTTLTIPANTVKDAAGNGNVAKTSTATTIVYATLGSSSRGLYEPGASYSTWSAKLNSYTVDPANGKITYNVTASLWLASAAYNYDTRTYQVCLSRYGGSDSAGTCYTTAATYYTGWKGTGSSATWSSTVNITTTTLPASGTYYYASSLRTDSGCCFGIGDTEGIVTTIYR